MSGNSGGCFNDTYENRFVKSFEQAVSRRLARLAHSLTKTDLITDGKAAGSRERSDALQESIDQRKRLFRARAQASFLDTVGDLRRAPDRISMVLLNKAPYRARSSDITNSCAVSGSVWRTPRWTLHLRISHTSTKSGARFTFCPYFSRPPLN